MLQEKKIRIGILGGGQLGAMLIRAAIDYGVAISVMDKDADAPAAAYTGSFTCADPLNYDAVVAFGLACDIVTIEKEAVNTSALKYLRDNGVQVHPSPELIETVQDKLYQKTFLEQQNIPVVPAVQVNDRAELSNYITKLPACLKMRRDGYDGRGVMMINTATDIDTAFDAPGILEDKIAIKQELSVIIARNQAGQIECYDPVAMMFNTEKHILDFQICPANIGSDTNRQAYDMAIKIAEKIGLVGIMAIEMFLTKDNNLLVNELAPRAHNSGHHTIEACATSQYEQQIRAILGLPLGDTRLISKAGMINIIEQNKLLDFAKIMNRPNTHVHYYGKKNSKPGRKIGHITVTQPSVEAVIAEIAIIKHLLN